MSSKDPVFQKFFVDLGNGLSCAAVSYTNLDVYKRQINKASYHQKKQVDHKKDRNGIADTLSLIHILQPS